MSKFLSLTKKQLGEYLDWAVVKSDGAGWANDYQHCPLVNAYRHFHPKSDVEVHTSVARVNNTTVSLRPWQYRFRSQVDSLATSSTKKYTVSVQQARRILQEA